METETIPDYPRGITFEHVWAALMEDRKKLEIWREEWEKEREQREKEREQSDKSLEKLERIVRRNSKQMGDLHRRFGNLAEHLVKPNIYKRFNELGYKFTSTVNKGSTIFDDQGKTLTEIDMVLENGNTIMVVEVKVKPDVKDIAHHIRRMEIVREVNDKKNDKRKIQGAIAGAIFGIEEKKATVEAGLYVIEQSGDTMKIDVPENFVPLEM